MKNRKEKVYQFFFVPAILLLIVFGLMENGQRTQYGGWIWLLFFCCLAVAFKSHKLLKGLSFTMIILAVVCIAMYHPSWFIEVGSFHFSILIVPLLQIIMFGMGTELSLGDFVRVLKIPRKVLIGVTCQFTIMPVVAFILTAIFRFPHEIAAGIILVGCCPSGLASNVMAYLAKANLALSVSVTTISTLLSPFLTPLLMGIFAENFVEIDFWKMMWDITKIVILPVGGGLIFNRLFHGKTQWLDKAMPIVSMAGIAIILTIMTAAGRDSLLKIGLILTLVTFIHNVAGYFLGYWASRMFRLEEQDCRAVALEVGMQNAGLASGLALTMGKMATVGVASVVFGPLMNITGSSLASWWYNHPPKGEERHNMEKL